MPSSDPSQHQSCRAILCIPIQSRSDNLRFIDYEFPVMLLDLMAHPAFGTTALRQESTIDGVKITKITLPDENDQSIKDLLQYLFHPYHFPIILGNYLNLLRLALKYHIVSLVEEIMIFMKSQPASSADRMFLVSCASHLTPVKEHFEDHIVANLVPFILNHSKQQISAVDSRTMSRLIRQFLVMNRVSPDDFRVFNVDHVAAFKVLFKYALQGDLYGDLYELLEPLANPGVQSKPESVLGVSLFKKGPGSQGTGSVRSISSLGKMKMMMMSRPSKVILAPESMGHGATRESSSTRLR